MMLAGLEEVEREIFGKIGRVRHAGPIDHPGLHGEVQLNLTCPMHDVGWGKQVVFEHFRSAADGWRAVLAHLVGILGERAEPETGGEMPSPPEEVEGEIFGK
ncbi:hypothetical protein C8J57DRAFT_1222464 [Mycena rebaudengoi]|nr:hypothetical protein C8J57DRAFT_1222464 [Mycena rebaudengoi]